MKKIFTSLVIILAIISSYAQSKEEDKDEITFEIEAPEEITIGQQFKLSYTLKGAEGSNLQTSIDKIKNADVLYGPSISSMSQSRVEAGKAVTSYTQTYTYVLQSTEKDGTINIPEATIEVRGKKYTAKAIKIKIVKDINSSKNKDKSSPKEKTKNSSKKIKEISDKDVFIRTIVSKTAAGIGDPIEITYRLYTVYDVAQVADYSTPSFSGFSVKRIPTSDEDDFVEEKYEGKKYKAIDIGKYIVYPQRTGKLDIQPFDMILLFESEPNQKKRDEMTRRERYNSMTQKKVSSEKISIVAGTAL